MYPNPLIPVHSGIYIKEAKTANALVEVFELRPDLYISWAVVPLDGDQYFEDLQFRGVWSVWPDHLRMILTDDESCDDAQFHYELKNGVWVLEDEPEVWLCKRSGMEAIQGPMYFDFR